MRTREEIVARIDEMGKDYETTVLATLGGILETQLDIRELLSPDKEVTDEELDATLETIKEP